MTQTQYKPKYNEFIDDPKNIRMEKDEYRPDFFERIELVDKKIDESINQQKEQVRQYVDEINSLKTELVKNVQDSHRYIQNRFDGEEKSKLTIFLMKVTLVLTIYATIIAPIINAPIGFFQSLPLPKIPFMPTASNVVRNIPGADKIFGEATGTDFAPVPSKLDPSKIVSAMQRKGYRIRSGPGELNVVYVFNPNFAQTIDTWSDRRLLITYKNGQPTIVHDSPATIKGGRPSWNNPPNPKGYPVTIPGQYPNSWAVGYHKGRRALQQVGPIPVMRTKDQGRTWRRDYGLFGINQHRGGGARVRNWSEGCLVSQSGHEAFMEIIYTDPGYRQNRSFRFITTLISMNDL